MMTNLAKTLKVGIHIHPNNLFLRNKHFSKLLYVKNHNNIEIELRKQNRNHIHSK